MHLLTHAVVVTTFDAERGTEAHDLSAYLLSGFFFGASLLPLDAAYVAAACQRIVAGSIYMGGAAARRLDVGAGAHAQFAACQERLRELEQSERACYRFAEHVYGRLDALRAAERVQSSRPVRVTHWFGRAVPPTAERLLGGVRLHFSDLPALARLVYAEMPPDPATDAYAGEADFVRDFVEVADDLVRGRRASLLHLPSMPEALLQADAQCHGRFAVYLAVCAGRVVRCGVTSNAVRTRLTDVALAAVHGGDADREAQSAALFGPDGALLQVRFATARLGKMAELAANLLLFGAPDWRMLQPRQDTAALLQIALQPQRSSVAQCRERVRLAAVPEAERRSWLDCMDAAPRYAAPFGGAEEPAAAAAATAETTLLHMTPLPWRAGQPLVDALRESVGPDHARVLSTGPALRHAIVLSTQPLQHDDDCVDSLPADLACVDNFGVGSATLALGASAMDHAAIFVQSMSGFDITAGLVVAGVSCGIWLDAYATVTTGDCSDNPSVFERQRVPEWGVKIVASLMELRVGHLIFMKQEPFDVVVPLCRVASDRVVSVWPTRAYAVNVRVVVLANGKRLYLGVPRVQVCVLSLSQSLLTTATPGRLHGQGGGRRGAAPTRPCGGRAPGHGPRARGRHWL
jgi:hypothetical protein